MISSIFVSQWTAQSWRKWCR